ncbi:hypothetical protein OG943_36980 [Amycolatopsis sp. NBC_00345]|uniref:hypothetical protein n=1 Tax=Amycolatopsis sp. NBC_00345 TaxID=2975955 RepID=UPI002E256405
MPSPSIPVPPRWRTVSTERTLLAVVHNVTAATRLLDVLSLFAGDPRIQTVFTCPGSSAFTRGTEEFLSARGIPLLPWPEAIRTEFDWALAASYGGDLHELRAPLTVVPHGMGYNKYLAAENQNVVFGLSTPWLMHEGQVVPTHVVLSHEEQLHRLRLACPPAAERAVVAGDPILDRLQANLPLRETYRQAFGVQPGQRLVVLSSTWGPESLFGHDPDLPRRIGSTLDPDAYRIVLALHPNIGQGHFRWQLETWLAESRRAGVLVLPDEKLWQPALVAADVTIGDHGSVTFYSACLGTPILLAAAPEDTVDPASPIAGLLHSAPRLSPDNLADQIEQVITRGQDYSHITALASSAPGKSAELLRDIGYEVLGFPPPPHPSTTNALPIPQVQIGNPSAQRIRVTGTHVERSAAGSHSYPDDAHLVVSVLDSDLTLLERAHVVVGPATLAPEQWIAATLRALPGALWAVCPVQHGWLAGNRGGTLVQYLTDGPAEAVPSVLHHRASNGAAASLEDFLLTTSKTSSSVKVTVVDPGRALR